MTGVGVKTSETEKEGKWETAKLPRYRQSPQLCTSAVYFNSADPVEYLRNYKYSIKICPCAACSAHMCVVEQLQGMVVRDVRCPCTILR